MNDHLRSYGIYDRIGDEHFHPNTISAVKKYEKAHDTEASG